MHSPAATWTLLLQCRANGPCSHLIYSKEFKGGREKPEFLLQLKYVVYRNLHSLVIHKLYQIPGVQKAKVMAVFPHSVFVLDTAQGR